MKNKILTTIAIIIAGLSSQHVYAQALYGAPYARTHQGATDIPDPNTFATSPAALSGNGTPFRDMVIRTSNIGQTQEPTGMSGMVNSNDVIIYPNPVMTNTRISLNTSPSSPVKIDVIDMNGNVARSYNFSPGLYNLDIDMTNLAAGIYSVRIYGTDVEYHNLKLVKQ